MKKGGNGKAEIAAHVVEREASAIRAGTVQVDCRSYLRVAYDRPEGAPPSVVDYYLEGRGGTTVMRLVHSGFGATANFDDEYESTGASWPEFLKMTKHSVERGMGACRNVSVFRILPERRESAWAKLMSVEEVHQGTVRHLDPVGCCCCMEFPGRQDAMLSILVRGALGERDADGHATPASF